MFKNRPTYFEKYKIKIGCFDLFNVKILFKAWNTWSKDVSKPKTSSTSGSDLFRYTHHVHYQMALANSMTFYATL